MIRCFGRNKSFKSLICRKYVKKWNELIISRHFSETFAGGTIIILCFQSVGERERTGFVMSRHLRFVARTVMVQDSNIDAAYKTLNRYCCIYKDILLKQIGFHARNDGLTLATRTIAWFPLNVTELRMRSNVVQGLPCWFSIAFCVCFFFFERIFSWSISWKYSINYFEGMQEQGTYKQRQYLVHYYHDCI